MIPAVFLPLLLAGLQDLPAWDAQGNALRAPDTLAPAAVSRPAPPPPAAPFPFQAGFPVQLPGSGLMVTTADLDGDGHVEIALRSNDEASAFSNWVHLLDWQGNPLPGWPRNQAGPGVNLVSTWNAPALADVDGDGTGEVVVACADYGMGMYRTWAWELDGSVMAGFPLVNGWPAGVDGDNTASPVLADLDGNGTLEILVPCVEDASSGDDLIWVFAYEGDGSLYPGWPARLTAPNKPPFGSMNRPDMFLAADLDGEGEPEVVLPVIQDRILHSLDATSRSSPGFWPVQNPLTPTFMRQPVAADLDGDGGLEVACCSSYDWFVLEPSGRLAFHWRTEPDEVYRGPVPGDLDGDGRLELVAGTLQGKVYAFEMDGTPLPGWPVDLGAAAEGWGLPATGDVTGDGVDDVVFGAYDGQLWALDGTGAVIPGFPVLYAPAYDRGGVAGAPVILDLDGDGDVEILFANVDNIFYTGDCKVFCYDLPAAWTGQATWPMHRADPRCTGALPPAAGAPRLVENHDRVSLFQPWPIHFDADFGPAAAGLPYVAVAGRSGRYPGTVVRGVEVHLNPDSLTGYTWQHPNQGALIAWQGVLDNQGRARFTLDLAQGSLPLAAGDVVEVLLGLRGGGGSVGGTPTPNTFYVLP